MNSAASIVFGGIVSHLMRHLKGVGLYEWTSPNATVENDVLEGVFVFPDVSDVVGCFGTGCPA